MGEVGRPSELSDEITFKIRKMIFDGSTYKSIQEALDISPDTWDGWVWRDYKGFRAFLTECEKEMIVDTAKTNLKVLLGSDDDRIRADLTKFALETLDKKNFSKRTEQTGADGQPIAHQITGMQIIKDNGNTIQDQEPKTTGSI